MDRFKKVVLLSGVAFLGACGKTKDDEDQVEENEKCEAVVLFEKNVDLWAENLKKSIGLIIKNNKLKEVEFSKVNSKFTFDGSITDGFGTYKLSKDPFEVEFKGKVEPKKADK